MLRTRMATELHQEQASRIEPPLQSADADMARLAATSQHMMQQLESILSWTHEGVGVIPLSQVADTVRAIEGLATDVGIRYPKVVEELRGAIDAAASNAPRVLNAGFVDPTTREVVEPSTPLRPGKEYDVLVDVGPRWNRIP